jgi:hypothetical protein
MELKVSIEYVGMPREILVYSIKLKYSCKLGKVN